MLLGQRNMPKGKFLSSAVDFQHGEGFVLNLSVDHKTPLKLWRCIELQDLEG